MERRWRGQFAEHLLAEYRRIKKTKTKTPSRAEIAVKYEALDMLEEMGAPPSVLTLFDTLLGGVVAAWDKDEAARRWVMPAIDYEAAALAGGREVTNAEIVDKVVRRTRRKNFNRRAALKEVVAVRKSDFYWSLVLTRKSEIEK